MTNINNFSQAQYQYEYSQSGTHVTNNFNLRSNGQQSYYMNIGKMSSATSSTGKIPFDIPSSKIKMGSRVVNFGKRVIKDFRPSQLLMMGIMAYAFLARSGVTPVNVNNESSKSVIEQAYKMGEKHIRDSLANAELTKKLKLAENAFKSVQKLPK